MRISILPSTRAEIPVIHKRSLETPTCRLAVMRSRGGKESADGDVIDPKSDEIAAPKLAVGDEVEHRQIAFVVLERSFIERSIVMHEKPR
jgi:hypothetical protein